MAHNTRTFTDLDLNFLAHPVTKDISTKTDEQAIKSSIRNLVLTSNYEKPFHPEIGSQIKSLLFEPATPMLPILIKKAIEYTIYNFEPRVNLIDLQAFPDFDNNSFDIKIIYEIVGADVPAQQLEFVLQPTR